MKMCDMQHLRLHHSATKQKNEAVKTSIKSAYATSFEANGIHHLYAYNVM